MLEQAKKLLSLQGHKDLSRLSYREVRHKGEVVAHLFRLSRDGQGSLRWQGIADAQGMLAVMQPTTTSERKHVQFNRSLPSEGAANPATPPRPPQRNARTHRANPRPNRNTSRTARNAARTPRPAGLARPAAPSTQPAVVQRKGQPPQA